MATAWLVGLGIMSYRSVRQNHHPPIPGSILAASGLFVLLGLLAQAQQARFLATALAWGFDIAAFANLYPPVTSGGTTSGTEAA
jgi:hypothetical protein